jgi:hypothetical protein
MGQEKVFLYLFDKYYSKGDTTWLNEKQRKFIFDRAYSLMANQLGEQGLICRCLIRPASLCHYMV